MREAFELAPGAVREWEAAHELATTIRAVPQYQTLPLSLNDGWSCWLDKYEYRPLNSPEEIRILRLHPWETRLQTNLGELPRCELLHMTLEQARNNYVALSYAWGSISEYSPVLVQDERCLTVTNSLCKALRSISGTEPLDLWVDQLCINQYDLTERNTQVRLIAQIFEQARTTWVWLGEEDHVIDAAYDLISRLSDCGITALESSQLLTTAEPSNLISSLEAYNITPDDVGWHGIESLAERPWFSRLWTFQEVVVSRRLTYLCGKRQCGHEELLRALYMLQLLFGHDVIEQTHMDLISTYKSRYHEDSTWLLPQLLRDVSTSDYQCLVPQDWVYALLALQHHQRRHYIDIGVDYEKPVGQVFEESARAIINTTGDLSILHRRRYGYLKDLPSWAPDWSVKCREEQINDGSMQFASAKGIRHDPREDVVGELMLKGRIIARVVKIAAHHFSFHADDYVQGELDIFLGSEQLIPLIYKALQHYASVNTKPDEESAAYRAWLMANTFTCGWFPQQDQADFLPSRGSAEVPDLVAYFIKRGPSFVRSLAKCLGRGIGLLDNEDCPLALIPDYSRTGDLVCIVEGSTTPLVIRKKEHGFSYIGECYVHGIMYGEGVTWAEGEGDSIKLI